MVSTISNFGKEGLLVVAALVIGGLNYLDNKLDKQDIKLEKEVGKLDIKLDKQDIKLEKEVGKLEIKLDKQDIKLDKILEQLKGRK